MQCDILALYKRRIVKSAYLNIANESKNANVKFNDQKLIVNRSESTNFTEDRERLASHEIIQSGYDTDQRFRVVGGQNALENSESSVIESAETWHTINP